MIRKDMAPVLEIEQESFFGHAWTEEDFIRCLRQRNCIGMVIELEDTVVGFMIYELHKTKLEILNFAVSPWYRRQGFGRLMLAILVGKLSFQRRWRIALGIRETNLDGQLFFRAFGFEVVGRDQAILRRGGVDEDNYRMVRRVQESDCNWVREMRAWCTK